MVRKLTIAIAVMSILVLTVSAVAAGNAQYPGNPNRNPTATVSGNTVLVTAKIAGLGNIDQITVRISGDAQCVNPGGNNPQAGNKQSFSSDFDTPVQNGKANFSGTLTATFSPSCSPPMTVAWSNVTISVDGFPELTRTLIP